MKETLPNPYDDQQTLPPRLRAQNGRISTPGQSYDNASAMSGKFNGLQSRVKERIPSASWIPCTAHSLNLVGKDAAACCSEAVKFFSLIEQVFVFFTASTNRYQKLKEKLIENGNTYSVKRITTTR